MRNLLTLLILAFFAAPAFAQSTGSTATVTQNGQSNEATATQSGGAELTATQGDYDNTLGATQEGASTAIITQSSTALPNSSGGHSATIRQVGGDDNFINLSQSFGTNALGAKGAHTADLNQEGAGNRIQGVADLSDVDNMGASSQDSRSNLSADIDQLGNNNTVEFRNGNPLSILQDGEGNFAHSVGGSNVDIDQLGNDNDVITVGTNAIIYQNGDLNTADVRAFGANATVDVNINQAGNSNMASAFQFRSGTFNVDQDGDFNSAVVDLGSGSGGASGTTAGVNYDITQNANGFGAASGSNMFEAEVRFNGNSATVEQTLTAAGMNSIELNQLSAGNSATLTQNGVGNTQSITQQ
jgi:hypothetical protein